MGNYEHIEVLLDCLFNFFYYYIIKEHLVFIVNYAETPSLELLRNLWSFKNFFIFYIWLLRIAFNACHNDFPFIKKISTTNNFNFISNFLGSLSLLFNSLSLFYLKRYFKRR